MGVLSKTDRPWTDDEKAYIIRNLDAGYTYAEIAEGLGRSRSSIAGQVRRMRGHKDKPRIAPAMSRSQAARSGVVKQIDRVAELLAEGFELSEIVDELNTTRNAVKCAFRKIRRELGWQAR